MDVSIKNRCGVKTSEFHVTILALVAGFVAATFFEVSAGEIGAFNAPVIAYIGGRSFVKR